MPDDPGEAGVPRTRGATRTYADDRIRVLWDATRCIHTAICLRGLPTVFDVETRPWIDLDGAEPDEIATTIRACPTGALRYDGPGVAPEQADEPTTVEVRRNGPLLMRGPLSIHTPESNERHQEFRVALCRCGASQNKPFCDNSHRAIHFRDTSQPAEGFQQQ